MVGVAIRGLREVSPEETGMTGNLRGVLRVSSREARHDVGALTNDRTRFPNTYIGMHISQHAAWTAPTTRSVRLTPAERTLRLAKNVVP